MKCIRLSLLSLTLTVVSIGLLIHPAEAQVPLPIANSGFENPVQGNDAFTTTGIIGWTNSTESGVWRPGAGRFSTPVPEGSQIGYINGNGAVAQALSSTLQPGLYNLSTQVGRRNDGFVGDIALELWAGGVVSAGNVTGGTQLATATLTVALQTLGGFTPLSTTFTAANNDPLLNQTLAVRIRMINGGQVDFDNVQLNFTASQGAAAPEPATGALALLALPAIGLLRRRK